MKDILRRIFYNEKWRLVKTLVSTDSITLVTTHKWTGEKVTDGIGDIYFHLFESNLGNRKVQIRSTISASRIINVQQKAEEIGKATPMFQEKIYRWLHGRYDPDILTYDEVPGNEVFNKVRGSVKTY